MPNHVDVVTFCGRPAGAGGGVFPEVVQSNNGAACSLQRQQGVLVEVAVGVGAVFLPGDYAGNGVDDDKFSVVVVGDGSEVLAAVGAIQGRHRGEGQVVQVGEVPWPVSHIAVSLGQVVATV